jgi:hypothetical protein
MAAVEIGAHVEFAHPLVRSASYQSPAEIGIASIARAER